MVALAGEIRPSLAAKMLKVHYRTVMRWAHRRVAGQESPIKHVRLGIEGGYYLNRAEIQQLRDQSVAAPPDFA